MSVELLVPDIGNFSDVAVVDVLVKPGDVVELETPAGHARDRQGLDGRAGERRRASITEVLLKRGDKVSKGSLIARLEPAAGTGRAAAASPRRSRRPQPRARADGRR